MVKIFITGATGYIGGDALHALLSLHPDFSYTALVRSGPRAVSLAATHPTLRLVYGDLSSTSLITSEARAADIVLHLADADDVSSARAIAEGLRSKPGGQVGFWIHLSGTGILTWKDVDRDTYGEESGEVYDDWEGVGAVTSLPDQALHRGVDKIVLAAGDDDAGRAGKVRTAVVCPPCIYGRGRGAGNTRSMQVPELARVTVERGEGVRVGKGRARWTGVHVGDLADLFVRLVEEAVVGGGKATWGREGYYFAEDGEFYWGDVSEWVLEEVRKLGLAKSEVVRELNKEEAIQATGGGHILWGANSRCKAIRARKLLGWQPKRHGLREEVKDAVEVEAKKLGKLPGHAAKAAGDA
ncbi:nucleoside-diphosphate-sugar epimerase [Elsinoe ampelina]|uniref:Nucleoside-diphosphate-sugar epimerase n=1 Tax=Elsinoe ampelina TaxID=302913 RepID=A0A6A6GI33_9PEZI|nr:nucleoside-diphosphate-sugar epimerase [Elsinoe ampelina]